MNLSRSYHDNCINQFVHSCKGFKSRKMVDTSNILDFWCEFVSVVDEGTGLGTINYLN